MQVSFDISAVIGDFTEVAMWVQGMAQIMQKCPLDLHQKSTQIRGTFLQYTFILYAIFPLLLKCKSIFGKRFSTEVQLRAKQTTPLLNKYY